MDLKIKELFSTILEVPIDNITDTISPNNFEKWDSLHHMFLVSAFEEEFDIEIEPEEVVEMYNDYDSFKALIIKKIN